MTNTSSPRGMPDHLADQLERDLPLMRVLLPLVMHPFVHRDQLAPHALPEAIEDAFGRVLVIRDIGGWYSSTVEGDAVALAWITQLMPWKRLPRFAALWSAVVEGTVSTDRAWPREDAD